MERRGIIPLCNEGRLREGIIERMVDMAGEQWIAEIRRQARAKGAPVATDDAAWTARCVENALINLYHWEDEDVGVGVAEDGAIEVVIRSTFILTLRIAPDTGAITGEIEPGI